MYKIMGEVVRDWK